MTTRSRIALTVGLGIVLGLHSWLGDAELAPSHEAYAVFGSTPAKIAVVACFIAVPMLVARFWVIGALADPLIALAILGATGKTVHEDGMAPPLNYVTITGYVFLGFLMLFESVAGRGLQGIQGRWQERRDSSDI